MTAPLDLSDDERELYDSVLEDSSNMCVMAFERDNYRDLAAVFQKLSDARAALRLCHQALYATRCVVDHASAYSAGKIDRAQSEIMVAHMSEALDGIAALAGTTAPVAVPAAPVDDVGRCAICAWPLAKDGLVSQGCVRGNCSFRGEPPIHPTQRYAPARAEIESAAARARGER